MSRTCRWGILSTAVIAKKNWQAITLAENARVSAVASRSVEKAEAFIAECTRACVVEQAPQAFGSYEELLACNEVDAVYVPLPTGIRKEWVIRAAQAGKHVMCEKPCAVSFEDLQEMVVACRANNVQFMDGVMFMHHKRMDQIRQCLDREVGDLRRICANFSFHAPQDFLSGNIRVNSELEPQGCFGDLGWYTIRFSLWAMNYRMPTRVAGRLISQHGSSDSPHPVPTEFSGEMFFDNGVSATFYNSFRTEHQQWVNVSGTKGNLHVQDFVLPYFGNQAEFEVHTPVFHVDGCDFNMERHTQRHVTGEYSNSMRDSQETNLFRKFSELALSGSQDDHWPEISLKTQLVMDTMLTSSREGGSMLELPAL